MRITTILIDGAVLAFLVGVVGFRLAQEEIEPPRVNEDDRGYLEAIEPPAEIGAPKDPTGPGEDRQPEPNAIATSRSEPDSRPATNRWARLREVGSDRETRPRAAKSDATPASSENQGEQETEIEPAAASADTPETEAKSEPRQDAESQPEPESAPEPEVEAESETEPEPETQSEPAPPEAARTYKIRAGDTLASIAIMHYADASKWRLIASANPTVNPRQLRIGQIVTLPPADRQVESGPDTPQNTILATHVVKKGDSLYSLAKRYYGDGTRWPAIRQANPGLKGASLHQLELGSKLVIPAGDDDDEAE